MIQWLTDHAVTVLIISVTAAVLTDFAVRLAWRRAVDIRSSLTSIVAGVTYIGAKGIVSKLLMLGVVIYIYENHRLFDLPLTAWWVWLAMFLCRDFVYYWIHRAEHRTQALWAAALVHHLSEEFTFTTAVRMPWMEALYKPLLGLWVPLLGFHPVAFTAMGALVLVIGQFQHTELLARTPWLDKLFITPSVHRVHHGSNPEYIDKNFGSLLSIWDRLFGTFQAETVPVAYGLTGGKQIATPAQVMVGGYPELAAAVRAAPSRRAGLRVLVAAPGSMSY